MAEETQYQGIRSGDGWIVKGTVTYREADEMIERHMHGGNREAIYWLEAEGDPLAAFFFDRNQPRSGNYPGNNAVAKDGMWRPNAGISFRQTQGLSEPEMTGERTGPFLKKEKA